MPSTVMYEAARERYIELLREAAHHRRSSPPVHRRRTQPSSSDASSIRDVTPVLANTLRRWKSTVRGLTNS